MTIVYFCIYCCNLPFTPFRGHTRLVPVHTHTKSGIQIEKEAVEGTGHGRGQGTARTKERARWNRLESV